MPEARISRGSWYVYIGHVIPGFCAYSAELEQGGMRTVPCSNSSVREQCGARTVRRANTALREQCGERTVRIVDIYRLNFS